MLKAFMEQVACNGFFLDPTARGFPKGRLKGRSARLVVTMGMPAIFYRLLNGAFERGILGLAGIKPVRRTLFGGAKAKLALPQCSRIALAFRWQRNREGPPCPS